MSTAFYIQAIETPHSHLVRCAKTEPVFISASLTGLANVHTYVSNTIQIQSTTVKLTTGEFKLYF